MENDIEELKNINSKRLTKLLKKYNYKNDLKKGKINNGFLENKAKKRTSDILFILNQLGIKKNFSELKIIDVGCNDGIISNSISKKLVLKNKIHAMDIDKTKFKNKYKKNVKFLTYIPKNEKYDIVLLLMVIHHIEKLDIFLKKISNISNKYLIIREHDAKNLEDIKFIDLQHKIINKLYKINDTYNCNMLKSAEEVKKKIFLYGFKEIKLKKYPYFYNNPTNYYYKVFRKIIN
jgi:hypothetical protein